MKKKYRKKKSSAPIARPLLRKDRILDPGRWLELFFLAAIWVIPLSFHTLTSHSIVAKDFFALWFCAVFVLGCAAVGPRARKTGAFAYFLGGFALWFALRLLFVDHPRHAIETSLVMASMMGAALPAFVLGGKPAAARRVAANLGAVALVACSYAAIQFVAEASGNRDWDPVRWDWTVVPGIAGLISAFEMDLSTFQWEPFEGFRTLPGVCSTFGNPNFFCGFIVPLCPLFATLVLGARKRREKVFCGAAAVSLGFGVLFAGSRGGILAAAGAAVLSLPFLGIEMARRRNNKAWKGLGSMTSATLTLLLIASLAYLTLGRTAQVEKDLGSIENRSIVYRSTFSLIRNNLLFGVGPGHFTIRFPEHLRGLDAEKYGWMEDPEEKVLEHAHSEYLEIASDLGIAGLLLYLAFFAGWFWWMIRSFEALGESRKRWAVAGVALGVGAVLFQNLTSVNLRWTSSGWVFWGLVGFGAGLTSLPVATSRTSKLPGSPARKLCAVAILAALVFVPVSRRVRADFLFTMGRNASMSNGAGAEEYLVRSLELNPSFAQTYYLLAGRYFGEERFEEAIDQYLQVREIRGDVVVLAENLATSYVKLSTTLEKEHDRQEALLTAIELFESSLQRHPSFPRLADYLGRTYAMIGLERKANVHREKAIELYDIWIREHLDTPRPQYAIDLCKCYLLEKNYVEAFRILWRADQWNANPDHVARLKEAVFQGDPSLVERWERAERKTAARKE